MKLITFSFTFTDLVLNATVILLTKDFTPLPSAKPLGESSYNEMKTSLLDSK